MSYVRHKSRAFREAGDMPEVIRRRSEGRLKTYPSTADARAWCDLIDDRKQQILDYVISDIERCSVGKYVPIDVLINTLLANKNSDCGKLKEQVEELQKLLDMYSKVELSEAQKAMLGGMQKEIGKAGRNLGSIADKSSKSSRTPAPGSVDSSNACAAVKREKEGTSCSALALDKNDDQDLKALVIKKDAEIIALKNQLAAKQSELDQLLSSKSTPSTRPTDGFKEVVKERDTLKQELQTSKHEIQSLKSRIDEPCVQEIEELEKQIQRLKSKGQLTADEEAEIIRKEIEVLKKYCAKLATIQDENQSLKLQVEDLKRAPQASSASQLSTPATRQLSTSAIPQPQKQSVPLQCTPAGSADDVNKLKKDLSDKIAKLNEVIAERDRLQEKIKKLEKELMKHQNLPDDLDTIRRKSEMLDSVSDECKKLRSSLESMKTVEQDISTLKKKANNADQLQNKLDSVNKDIETIRNQSAAEIQTLKSKNNEIIKERENYKKVAMEAKNMGEELKCLAHCAKEAETLKRERDNLRAKLQKLGGIEIQYKQLQDKVKYLETIKSEREMYKMKYEEMLGLECNCEMLKAQVDKFKNMDKDRDTLIGQVRDCECCIAEQEEEIKKLITHIDNMSRGNNEQQGQMQKKIYNMTNELNQKNNIIAKSEQQLSNVQDQLKKIIKGVSCETSVLRSRIAELEEQWTKKTDGQLAKLKSSCKSKNYGDQTDGANDEHYKEMLSQSKQTVKRISEELEKHFKEWESIKQDDLVRLKAENKTLKRVSVEASSSNPNQDVVGKYEEAKQKIAALEKELTECRADVERLTAESITLKQLTTEAQSTANKDEEWTGNNELTQKYEEEKRMNEELQLQLSKCKTTIEQLREGQAELERLNAENNTLKKLSVDLQSAANDKMDDVTVRINELESERKSVQEERDQLDAIVRQYKEAEVFGEEDMNQVETGKIGEQEKSVVGKTEIEELREELTKCKAELEKEIKHRQEQECAYRRSITSQAAPGYASASSQMFDSELQKCKQERDKLLAQIQDQKNEIALMIDKGVSPNLDKERQEKEGMQNLIKELQNQISAMEGGSPIVSNTAFEKLKAQLEKEQKKAASAEAKLKEICEAQGLALPKIEVSEASDLKRLSQAYEERINQSMLELQLANSIKKQQDQEIKSLHNKFNDGIVKLQSSHEEVLKEVDKEHQKEIENLRSELRSSKEAIAGYEKLVGNVVSISHQVSSDKISTSDKMHSDKISISDKTPSDKISASYKMPSDKILTSDTMLSEQILTSDKMPSDNILTSDKMPSDKILTSDKIPSDKILTSDKIPSDKILTSDKMPSDKILTSDKMPSDKISISDKMPSDNISIGDKMLSDKISTRDKIRSDKHSIGPGAPDSEPGTLEDTMGSVKKSSLIKTTQGSVDIAPVDKANVETSPISQICKCGPALRVILQKVVQYGFESLNFEELKLLHNKTCEATAALLRKCPVVNRSIPFTCNAPMPTDEDRQRLIKRITVLENDLLKKQKQTQDKVGALQVAVRMEKQRLLDFKSLLNTEKNRNNELMCKIGAQSRTVANMQVERELMLKKSSFNEEKLQSLIRHCEDEKMRIRQLEEDLGKEKALHKREIESLYEIQTRPPRQQPNLKSAASQPPGSCCCRNLTIQRCSPEVEVECYMPATVENKKNFAEQCCMKKRRRSTKSARSEYQSDLEDLD